MAELTASLLNIGDMIDLAIGTPEMGVVDFGMLHTVLHCLAQQMRVLDKQVELRGSATVLPPGKDNGRTVTINEYVVDTDENATDEKVLKKTEISPASPHLPDQNTILVVERRKKTPAKGRSPRTHSPKVPMPREIGSTEKLSLVTISKFNILETAVEDLKNRVYGVMPKNEEILEEVRSQTNLKAITDMWTNLNVSSRLEAAETGIAKLSSLVQDVLTSSTTLEDLQHRSAIEPSSLAPPSSIAPPSSMAPPSSIAHRPSTPAPLEPSQQISTIEELGSTEELANLQSRLDRIRADLDNLANTFYTAFGDLRTGSTTASRAEAESVILPTPRPSERKSEVSQRVSAMTANLMERIAELEKRINECCDSIGKNDGVVQDQINSFQDQLEYLIKQVAELTEELASGKLSPDLVKDLQGLMTLFQTVQEMQEQLKEVHETAIQLANEKDDRQHNMNALQEQIELLKTIKLDREDMIEAMAEKADLRMVARKVSHDQFELACDDLSRGLDHTLGKLNTQEALWQQALDDIQREIETKLDKMELSPVKDFFNTKLRLLQDNLKQMASLRKEVEAAGTKRRLLRDVNCISCDANAVMPTEPPSTVPVLRPLPANMSMKPYLSYELDAIRKTQATNVPQRNLHDWENMEKQMTQPKSPQKPKTDSKHICNRYCGGSHTVTTAAQRVARLGHFVKQWGPDVVPLSSGLAAGDDGRLYKVSPAAEEKVDAGEGTADVSCTPRTLKKGDQTKPPQKPALVSAQECRCLDGGGEQQTKG